MRAITSTQPELSAEAGLFICALHLHSPRSITSATTKKSHLTKFASPLANQDIRAITSTQPELSAEAGLFIFALRLHSSLSITSAQQHTTNKSHLTSARPPTRRNQDQRPARSAAAQRSGSDSTDTHPSSDLPACACRSGPTTEPNCRASKTNTTRSATDASRGATGTAKKARNTAPAIREGNTALQGHGAGGVRQLEHRR